MVKNQSILIIDILHKKIKECHRNVTTRDIFYPFTKVSKDHLIIV